MYNAVTINQSHVSHFTYDNNVNDFILSFELLTLIILIFISLTMYISFASLIKPLRLLILVSYPSSSPLILYELQLKVRFETLIVLFFFYIFKQPLVVING
jgi:hypothetical protein